MLSELGLQPGEGVALFGKVEKEGLARGSTEWLPGGTPGTVLTLHSHPLCSLSLFARSPALGAQHCLVP